MSGKIKAKDLTYDSALPPFLQKLHAQNAGITDTGRHERPTARPRKDRDANDDDDPTIVDINGETLSKDDVQNMSKPPNRVDGERVLSRDATAKEDVHQAASTSQAGARTLTEQITDGVTVKKRKLAKVVGENTRPDDSHTGKEKHYVQKPGTRPKKAKKVKLAFDDED